MKTLEEILKSFPPQYASQLPGSSQAWYFILKDGRVIGGGEDNKHYVILGIKDDAEGAETHYEQEVQFCRDNEALRISTGDGLLNVEIFQVAPNELQWSAIGKIYLKTNARQMSWDIWVETKDDWSGGEGTLMEFKRAIERARLASRLA